MTASKLERKQRIDKYKNYQKHFLIGVSSFLGRQAPF
jgi:hypothetical protein